MPQIFDPLDPSVQILADTLPGGACLQLSQDIPDGENYTPAQMRWGHMSLASIVPGSLTNDQKIAFINALGVQQSPPAVISELDTKGRMLTDAYRFINGRVYGVRRLVQADCTGYSDRSDVAPVGNPWRCLNGTGNSGLWNASYQWLRFNFLGKNVWRVVLKHNNGDVSNSRSATVGGVSIGTLTSTTGIHTRIWESPRPEGYTSATYVNYSEAQCRTMLEDWQVWISNPTPPPLSNSYVLQPGDYFRLENTQGIISYLKYEGLDSVSGAWFATPIDRLTAFDGSLIAGSTNAPQTAVVLAAINQQRDYIDQRFNEATRQATEWLYVANMSERNALTAEQAGNKLVRVEDSGSGDWAVYRGIITLTDNPDDPPVLSWSLEFSKGATGTVTQGVLDQINQQQALITQQATTIANLQTAIANLQTAISPLNIWVSAQTPPDFDQPDWRFWQHAALSGVDLRVRLYQRLMLTGDAIQLQDFRTPWIPTPQNAVPVPGQPGVLRQQLMEGVSFTYTTTPAMNIGGIDFYRVDLATDLGVLADFTYRGLNAQRQEINGLNGGGLVTGSTFTMMFRKSQGLEIAAFTQFDFTLIDGTHVFYEF